jgi:hypothetical protein
VRAPGSDGAGEQWPVPLSRSFISTPDGDGPEGTTGRKVRPVRPEPPTLAGVGWQHPAIQYACAPWKASASEVGRAGTASWGHLYGLRAALAAAAEHEHAIARRRRAMASAGGTLVILTAVALLATALIAETASGSSALTSAHHAAAPGLAFEQARPLLIVATSLIIATASTGVMLAVLKPRRKAPRRPYGLPTPKPRPVSRVQRHRTAIVLAAGVAPVLFGGAYPFIAHLLPIGLQIDASSEVGTNLLDVVIGFAVPATVLSVLYFRWVARLASAETRDSEHV